jgi:hypothetical protein
MKCAIATTFAGPLRAIQNFVLTAPSFLIMVMTMLTVSHRHHHHHAHHSAAAGVSG